MEELSGRSQHKVNMVGRKTCMLTGVVDVISFDLGEIVLETDMGMLMIKGNDLHIKRLTLEKGEVDMEGKIDSFEYSEHNSLAAKSESFFGRLFK